MNEALTADKKLLFYLDWSNYLSCYIEKCYFEKFYGFKQQDSMNCKPNLRRAYIDIPSWTRIWTTSLQSAKCFNNMRSGQPGFIRAFFLKFCGQIFFQTAFWKVIPLCPLHRTWSAYSKKFSQKSLNETSSTVNFLTNELFRHSIWLIPQFFLNW